MTIFWPSTHPSSRSLCRNASSRGGLSEGDVTPRKPIRGTFPACCASAASGAASRLRVSVTMHQTVLHHIVISSQRPHADRLLLKPNNLLSDKYVVISNIAGYCDKILYACSPQDNRPFEAERWASGAANGRSEE